MKAVAPALAREVTYDDLELLMVARHQQPSTGSSRTPRSPLKLVMRCGSLC
jgi:hypothetical protein